MQDKQISNKKQLAYKINIEVYSDGSSRLQCTLPNIHPASLIYILSGQLQKLSEMIIQDFKSKKQKVQLVDPSKLPINMKLRS